MFYKTFMKNKTYLQQQEQESTKDVYKLFSRFYFFLHLYLKLSTKR